MKLNNKGFAITSIIYSMLILFLTLVVLIISNLASRKVVFDKQKEEIMNKFEEYENIEDGTVVYFDVTTGKVCNNYHEDNSKPGYNGISTTKTTSNQNGCLKFYVFKNYEDEQRLNLLLDHNTTATVNWDDSGDNQYGPRTLLAKLQDDTGSWVGTEQPSNYTDTLINKTINYEGYKARLITEEDIYNITGVPNIYFFTADGNQTETCREGDNSGCLYRWLYDGMNVNGGYWAANAHSASAYGIKFARIVRFETFNANGVSNTFYQGNSFNDQYYGLRPVIEVLRSKIINNILPEEYQQVEYIKSTGGQYINTGFYPTSKTKVVANVKFENYKGIEIDNGRLFSAVNYLEDKGFSINFGADENQYKTLFAWASRIYDRHLDKYYSPGWPVNNVEVSEDIVFNKNQIEMTYERLIYGSYSLDFVITENTKWPDNADTVAAPLYIFGGVYVPDEGETFDENNIIPFSIYQYMYVYDFKIYDNNILVRNFVPCYIKPCYDNAGTVGLYDLVENKFYPSGSGQNFEYGNEV